MTAASRLPTAHTRQALAKINLYLHVTGQRADGYHTLDSLVVFAGVGDVVTVKPAADLSLEVTGPFAAELQDNLDNNLVVQAARQLAQHAHIPPRARLTLEKNLPVASGIGGGSADAAAALRALIELWNLRTADPHIRHAAHTLSGDDRDTRRVLETLFTLWRDDLHADLMANVALKLGADVPVCLEGRAVFMGGIGEDLELAPTLPKAWFVLANPGVALSTPAVFQARDGEFSAPARFSEAPQSALHLAQLLQERRNDLTAPACALSPVVGEVLDALAAQDGALLTRMSGSGATCFALFETQTEAEAAAERLGRAHPAWWVQAAPMVDTPPEWGLPDET